MPNVCMFVFVMSPSVCLCLCVCVFMPARVCLVCIQGAWGLPMAEPRKRGFHPGLSLIREGSLIPSHPMPWFICILCQEVMEFCATVCSENLEDVIVMCMQPLAKSILIYYVSRLSSFFPHSSLSLGRTWSWKPQREREIYHDCCCFTEGESLGSEALHPNTNLDRCCVVGRNPVGPVPNVSRAYSSEWNNVCYSGCCSTCEPEGQFSIQPGHTALCHIYVYVCTFTSCVLSSLILDNIQHSPACLDILLVNSN